MPDTMMPTSDMLLSDPPMSTAEIQMRVENKRLGQMNRDLLRMIAELDMARAPFNPKDPTFDPRYGDQCDDGPIDPPATKSGVFPARALGLHAQRIGFFTPR